MDELDTSDINEIQSYDNFYQTLFLQPDEECTLPEEVFFRVVREKFRERLHEPKTEDQHKNLLRAYYALSNQDRKKAYDVFKSVSINLGEYLKSTHRKAEEGDLQGLQKDVSEGQRIDVVDDNGHTPLYVACRAAALPVVAWMLENGANPVCLTWHFSFLSF